MKTRTLLLGLTMAGLAQGAAHAVSVPDTLELMMHTGPESPDLAVIKVDGEPNGRYDKVLTDTLEYDVFVRGDRPDDGVSPVLAVWLEDVDSNAGGWSSDWKKHTLTMPYRDPAGTAPAKLCNDRLKKTSGADREVFLKNGATFSHPGAYTVYASVEWIIDRFTDSRSTWREEMTVPVKIKCLGLNRNVKEPKPSRTTPPPKPSRTTPPLLSKPTFEIEPSKIVKDGKYLCPSELRLYGYIETSHAFEGKSIFMGPHYLSAVTELDFPKGGSSRNVIGTYPIEWHQIGGLAAQANAKPADQKLAFRFNISDADGKLVKSMAKTVTVSCSKIKPNDAAVGGEMTTPPAN